jgi:hypothetical protein
VFDQVRVQARDLLLGDLDLLQCRSDPLEGEIAVLATQRDQPSKLLGVLERRSSRILIQPLRDRL